MSQDLREMFRNEEGPASEKLPEGHKRRFEAKLDEALPKETSGSNYLFLKLAAVLIVVFGVGFIFFLPSEGNKFLKNEVVETPVDEEQDEKELERPFQVSDVSPEFRKIENYYLASLNFEIAKLEITEENKALLDAFMKQLAELEKEYKRLNNEFSEIGANEQTVEALIVNLQLRLELLYKVKSKIKEIKESKNEQHENFQV
ncbi:hypothetical protein GCM10007103_07580 [Salinimicrobium marinum]|uniref:Uncharacterized protein n=1 Tax=Salinimicrobium marinum TaxID=680283 RepID=A0A918VV32_9FLAO|nr:hypothetical protein [Salinimicrobium marinum]GHA28450.1 hypothetical protein GCM10007103_07580 [Salinimicrobium marinum]